MNDCTGFAQGDAWKRPSGGYRSIALTDPRLSEVTSILLDPIAALVPTTAWTDLAAPVEFAFTRNDFNVWEAHVPALEGLHGKTLRAVLTHDPSAGSASAQLVPLGGDQPGWRPIFRPVSGRETIWSEATVGDAFTIRVDATD